MSVSAPPSQSAGRATPRPLVLHGIGVAPGIVIARALVFQHQETPIFRVPLLRSEVAEEVARLESARNLTQGQLQELKARTVEALGEDHGYIFDAHMLMLDDPRVTGRIEQVIREQRVNAEWAAQLTLNELSMVFDDLEDDYFRARRSDIYDVIGGLVRNLAGTPSRTLEKMEGKYILLSENVRPSDTARLDWEHMAGLAMEAGSRTYHTAIIARSLGIPCAVGVRDLMAKVDHGAPLILDGGEGIVVVNPDRATLRDYRARSRRQKLAEQKLAHLRELPAQTQDGYRIVLQANVEFPEECAPARSQGAEGIGLFRSEWFLTRNRGQFPSEEEQYLVYRSMAEQMKPWSVIVRAFDLSPDQLGKDVGPSEANPALGLRAIRLLLKRRDLFKEQLRALLRARAEGNVKVMFPMVSGVGELRDALAVVEEAKEELSREGIRFGDDLPCGVTLEVPSAAVVADLLAREAAFFSIGTNDLIQYLIGVDRGNDQVSYLYEPLHPGVLRTLRFVIDSAHAAGIKVGMCGEMAADPMLIVLLIGFGLDELSMNGVSIPMVKNIIRHLSAKEAKQVAEEALRLPTVKEVSGFLNEKLRGLVSERR
ncbi:MAG: phosphoenolpyruvate--protein phosphotransferase [Vicinamibacteria bacterium]